MKVFPDFGLCIFKHPGAYLAFRSGPKELREGGAHLHYDAFSIELMIDGKDVITEAGTFVYTAHPDERLKYRSFNAHFVSKFLPAFFDESREIFRISNFMPVHLAGVWNFGALARMNGQDCTLEVMINITNNSIELLAAWGNSGIPPIAKSNASILPISISYGIRLKS